MFIYITTNLINGKKYIGQHTTKTLDDGYLGSGKALKHAVNKYGVENFKKEIIHFATSQEELNKLEKFYIDKFDACFNPNFYNIHIGGSGGNTKLGFTQEQQQEFSEKMSKIVSGENNGMHGKKHIEEAIYVMSEARKEYFGQLSDTELEEFKMKMSKVTLGENNGMYGKTHSDQSKIKMSVNSKGKTSGMKNGMFNKKGENALNGQKVFMCDSDWNIIREFNTTLEALKFLGVKGHVSLYKACKQKTPYKGYYWKKEFSSKVKLESVVE
jgi:hypothetical protein